MPSRQQSASRTEGRALVKSCTSIPYVILCVGTLLFLFYHVLSLIVYMHVLYLNAQPKFGIEYISSMPNRLRLQRVLLHNRQRIHVPTYTTMDVQLRAQGRKVASVSDLWNCTLNLWQNHCPSSFLVFFFSQKRTDAHHGVGLFL